jgi:NAD(P)-dependent dehydrogenase (short-subunit alcohol dehydrogenase family)
VCSGFPSGNATIKNMSKTLSGRIALVTGASRGIGRSAAIALGEAGAHVICVARTVGGLEETDDAIQKAGGTATLVPLNLKDFAAMDRLGASIYERWGKLDALLGNAAILGALTPLAQLDPKLFGELLDINVTANWRLIRALDPLLRQSDAGRALFMTSGAAVKHTPYWGGYAMSKAALESLVLTYAAECEGTAVKVNLFNPGATRTAMRAKAMPGEDRSGLKRPEDIAPMIVELLSPACTRHGERVNFQN